MHAEISHPVPLSSGSHDIARIAPKDAIVPPKSNTAITRVPLEISASVPLKPSSLPATLEQARNELPSAEPAAACPPRGNLASVESPLDESLPTGASTGSAGLPEEAANYSPSSMAVSKRLLAKYEDAALGGGGVGPDTATTRLVKRARVAVESLNATDNYSVLNVRKNASPAAQKAVKSMIQSTQLAQLELFDEYEFHLFARSKNPTASVPDETFMTLFSPTLGSVFNANPALSNRTQEMHDSVPAVSGGAGTATADRADSPYDDALFSARVARAKSCIQMGVDLAEVLAEERVERDVSGTFTGNSRKNFHASGTQGQPNTLKLPTCAVAKEKQSTPITNRVPPTCGLSRAVQSDMSISWYTNKPRFLRAGSVLNFKMALSDVPQHLWGQSFHSLKHIWISMLKLVRLACATKSGGEGAEWTGQIKYIRFCAPWLPREVTLPLQEIPAGTTVLRKETNGKSYAAPLHFKISSDVKPREDSGDIEYTLCSPSKLSGPSTSLSGTGLNPATSLAVTIALYSMKESSFKSALYNATRTG